MSGQPAVLQVVILRDGLLVGTEVLIPGTYAIGSSPQADLRLDDPMIGEKHAILYFQNGKAAVQDAGTPGGVYVNGHRVSACQVRSVDEVACGPFVLKARVLSQKPVERNQPPPEVAALLMPPAQANPPAQPEPVAPQGAHAQVLASTVPSARVQRAAPGDHHQMTVPSVRLQGLSERAAPPVAQPPRPTGERPAFPATQPPRPTGERPASPAAQPPRSTGERPAPALAAQPPRATGERPAPALAAQPPRTTGERPAPAAVRPPPASAPKAPNVVVSRLEAGFFGTPVDFDAPPPPGGPMSRDSLLELEGGDPPPDALTQLTEAAPEADLTLTGFDPAASGFDFANESSGLELANEPSGLELASEPAPVGRRSTPAPTTRMRAAPTPPPPQAPRAAPSGELPSTVRVGPGGKGKPRLYAEFYWGNVRREARNFLANEKKPIVAAPSEDAPLPVYGFSLQEQGILLAEPQAETFRVFVPKGATQVERCKFGEPFTRVDPRGLGGEGRRPSLTLSSGMAVRFIDDNQHALVAYVAPPPERIFVNPLKGLPHLAFASFIVLFGAFLAFIRFLPRQDELPDFTARDLAPVAVRLIAPEPKKKEEAQKKLKEIKDKAAEKKKKAPEKVEKVEKAVKQVEKSVPKAVAAAPETRALKALAKLSAAGAAMNDLLAAVDKMGSGPGSKTAKTNYKLSGLIGKAPIASAGLGTFGLGGGGKGGRGTLGAELLHGKGAGGIGALGVGSVGKGAVGGTVSHATARAISTTQGSIDREAVAKVVNSHLHEVFACYEKALLKDPSLAGKVMLEWTIGGSGRVTTVKTKNSTLRSSAVESCIIDNLKGWTFPSPKGGSVIITYPFVFNSVGY